MNPYIVYYQNSSSLGTQGHTGFLSSTVRKGLLEGLSTKRLQRPQQRRLQESREPSEQLRNPADVSFCLWGCAFLKSMPKDSAHTYHTEDLKQSGNLEQSQYRSQGDTPHPPYRAFFTSYTMLYPVLLHTLLYTILVF